MVFLCQNQGKKILSFVFGKEAAEALRVHPTQVYELIGATLCIIIVMILKERIKLDGQKAILFAVLFTLMRWAVYYYRDLPYSDGVMKWGGYPMFYLVLVLIGIVMFRYRVRGKVNHKAVTYER